MSAVRFSTSTDIKDDIKTYDLSVKTFAER